MAKTLVKSAVSGNGKVYYRTDPTVTKIPKGTSSQTTSGDTPYMDAYRKYADQAAVNYNTRVQAEQKNRENYLKEQSAARDKWLNEQSSLRDAYLAQAAKTNAQNVSNTNTNYDSSARQNYINYMQAQKQLPSALNSLGIRGGASESSLIRLGSNYGTNIANNESSRNAALAALAQQYAQELADYDTSYRQARQSYDDTYNNRLASYEDSYNKLLSDLASEKSEALNSAYMTAIQNDLTYQKEMRDKDLANFKDSIMGRYTTLEGYDKLIEKLKNSNDPDKKTKIAYARQAKTALAKELKEQAKSSSGGGYSSYGGSGGYSSYGGSSGSDDSSTTDTDNYNKAVDAINAAQTRGAGMTEYYQNLAKKGSTSRTKKVWANNWSR